MLTSHDRFSASFATVADLTNDEHTRTFLTLEVGAGHGNVSCVRTRRVVALVDD